MNSLLQLRPAAVALRSAPCCSVLSRKIHGGVTATALALHLNYPQRQHSFCTAVQGSSHSLRRSHTAASSSPSTQHHSPAEPSSNPVMSTEELRSLARDAVIWASQHGLVYALSGPDISAPEASTIHAPLALLPVQFPRARFQQAKAVQCAFNLLVDAVAADEQYLEDTLRLAAKEDEFTGRLLSLLKSTRDTRMRLRDSGRERLLGVHRSDYMLDAPSGRFLQVELNTIASSFGCLSSLTSQLHGYMLSRTAAMDPANLPDNPAIHKIPDSIAAAAHAYGAPGSVVVMVVQPGERNVYDQQWIQLGLWERHRLRTVRMTLAEIAVQATLHEDGRLTLGPEHTTVSVVYFRAGYTPVDYPTELEWQGREKVELSDAVKCPSVAYQLAGAKKVQQALAEPGALERFVGAEQCAQLRGFFAGLWSLDNLSDPATAEVVRQAIEQPDLFVLKPQREGGGNNFYGEELRARLQQAAGLSAFILMQRIRPPPTRSTMVRLGQPLQADTVSELGIYGAFLKAGGQVLLNEEIGHLVRTKASNSNEGGVAAGFAVLDSPYLT